MEAAGMPQPKRSAATSTDIREKEDESGPQIKEEDENALQRFSSSEPDESWVILNEGETDDASEHDEIGRLADNMLMLKISSEPKPVNPKRNAEESNDLQRSEDGNDDVTDTPPDRQPVYPLEPITPIENPSSTDNIMTEEDSKLKDKEDSQKRNLVDIEVGDTKDGQFLVQVPNKAIDEVEVKVNSVDGVDLKENGAQEETHKSTLPSVQSARIGSDAERYTPPRLDTTASTQESDDRDSTNHDVSSVSKNLRAYDIDQPRATSQDTDINGEGGKDGTDDESDQVKIDRLADEVLMLQISGEPQEDNPKNNATEDADDPQRSEDENNIN
ncbi:uncharacterized protein [Amphiura filiformis]|uniref:uncharacterized protein n=1 Tax=Amphiura filiformis TaxID=82378 RepID=UPI003B2194D7